MPTVLVTGANRGIGLEFARQYAADGWRVVGVVRDAARAGDLYAIEGDVAVLQADVTSDRQVSELAAALRGQPIDLLINNAGIFGPRGLGIEDEIDFSEWVEVMRVNVLSPVRVLAALLSNLEAGGRRQVINLSSRMGSVGEGGGGAYPYRSSKAALNAAMKNIAVDLAGRGLTIVVVHPGWVRTDMGGSSASVSPKDSVTGLRALADRLTPDDTGRFFDHLGEEIPW